MKITAKHLADLRGSGLSDSQIVKCGFYSTSSGNAIRDMLCWKHYDGHLGPCLAIPFFDIHGNPTKYVRLKPDRPRKDAEGKPIKYESPQGVGNHVYFPPMSRQVYSSFVPVVITEGEKKAAKADQDGYYCLGLVGVYGWQQKREMRDGKPVGERLLVNDLAAIGWKGRCVYIVYDSDAATNQNVMRAELHLAEALKKRGAIVRIVRLPSLDGKKCGLDDMLVLRGARFLDYLISVSPTT